MSGVEGQDALPVGTLDRPDIQRREVTGQRTTARRKKQEFHSKFQN
jgi:hypothetical protein